MDIWGIVGWIGFFIMGGIALIMNYVWMRLCRCSPEARQDTMRSKTVE